MKKTWLLIFSVGLFSLFFLMVNDEQLPKNAGVTRGDSFLEGLRIIHRKDGRQEWVLTARRADITPKGDQARLSDVTVSFADKGVTVSADRGVYVIPTKNLSVDGKIVAKGENFSVISEGAEIDSTSGSLRTAGPVVIEGKKFRVRGKGMQADESGQTVRILHDVDAVFNN